MTPRTLATAAGLLLGLLGTAQQAGAQTPTFGVQGGLVIPTGDLGSALDNRFGFVVGGHMGLYYGNGHELRPRLEISQFVGGWHPVGNGQFDKSNVSAWGLGADYVYYTDLRPTGFYLLMGLGNQWWHVAPNHGPSQSHSALCLSAGAGLRMNRYLAFEGRFSTGQFRSDNGQANQLQGVVSYRF